MFYPAVGQVILLIAERREGVAWTFSSEYGDALASLREQVGDPACEPTAVYSSVPQVRVSPWGEIEVHQGARAPVLLHGAPPRVRKRFEQVYCDGAHIPSAIAAEAGENGFVDFYDGPDTRADPTRDTKMAPGGAWNIAHWRRRGRVEVKRRVV